jgi:hypothetical protein
MSKYINVYIANGHPIDSIGNNWTYLYQKPETLFNTLYKDKAPVINKNLPYFSCPAVAEKFKKTLVFKNTIEGTVSYDFRDGKQDIQTLTKQGLNAFVLDNRNPSINSGPLITFGMSYYMFAEESLPVYFTPPFFQKPGYTQDATILPGEFDIGNWFRPYNFEVQTWSQNGEISLKANEPIFYAEFKTDKKIKLHNFTLTNEIESYSVANRDSKKIFGFGQPLSEKYSIFKQYGVREKILTQIKKNLINEEPFIF